jgi:hypothetical protein
MSLVDYHLQVEMLVEHICICNDKSAYENRQDVIHHSGIINIDIVISQEVNEAAAVYFSNCLISC